MARFLLIIILSILAATYFFSPTTELDDFVSKVNKDMVNLSEQADTKHSFYISKKEVQRLETLLKQGNWHLMMRHGEQKMSPKVLALQTLAKRKIAMMRQDENLNNPLTELSFVKLEGVTQVIHYLQKKLKQDWKIETSANLRASQSAEVIALSLGKSPEKNKVWDCVNYPEEQQISTTELLELLPNGTLQWDVETVDMIIGLGTYNSIHHEAKTAIQNENRTTIVLTHTQQINALSEQHKLPIKRLKTYGFILIPHDTTQEAVVFENGFFSR